MKGKIIVVGNPCQKCGRQMIGDHCDYCFIKMIHDNLSKVKEAKSK